METTASTAFFIASSLSVIYPLIPCVLGAAVGASLARVFARNQTGSSAIYAGSGGFLAYFALALAMWSLNINGHKIFLAPYLLLLAFLAVVALLVWWYLERRCRLQTHRGQRGSWIWLFPALVALLALYQQALAPTAAWDTLSFWSKWAVELLEFDAGRDPGLVYDKSHYRHPVTSVYFAAFSGYASSRGVLGYGELGAWWAIWVCGGTIMAGSVWRLSDNQWLAAAVCYGYFSFPLLENHAILDGYADLWIAISVTLAAAHIVLGLSFRRVLHLTLGVLLAIAPIFLKNTGILYTLALLAPLIAIALAKKSIWIPLVFFTVLGCLGLWFFFQGFDLSLFGRRFAIVWNDPSQIHFGGYRFNFVVFPWRSIIWNDFYAFFFNQSFSVLAPMAMISAVFYAFLRRRLSTGEQRSLFFLLAASVALLVLFMIPQLVEYYALRFAVPDGDRGNSRFLLAFGPLVLLSLAFWPKVLTTALPQMDGGPRQISR